MNLAMASRDDDQIRTESPRASLSEQRDALKELSLFNWYLIWDTFSFRWMLVDYERESDVKSKCAARQTNIGVISALLFTVWASYLYESPKKSSIFIGGYEIGKMPEGVYYVFIIIALYCSLFSVFTATILYILQDACSGDTQARKFLSKVGHLFSAPSLWLLMGCFSGGFGVYARFLMEVDIYTWFIMAFVGLASSFSFCILCVHCVKHYYECKLEDEEPLPSKSMVRCMFLDVAAPSSPRTLHERLYKLLRLLGDFIYSNRTQPAGSAFPATSAAPSSPSTPAPASIGLSLLPESCA